ncbi:hypothetical protein BDZ94DRAFT_1270111 [Collybia nuda]|uniref:Uncharacterized protein n=1 Tax=Collybia nuda TaxID=64659 RepID=A0A9P5XXK5_9AGAR|nr:hypothetical protein BDZ94DRAFT_1270111 [Collybia nuda]
MLHTIDGYHWSIWLQTIISRNATTCVSMGKMASVYITSKNIVQSTSSNGAQKTWWIYGVHLTLAFAGLALAASATTATIHTTYGF